MGQECGNFPWKTWWEEKDPHMHPSHEENTPALPGGEPEDVDLLGVGVDRVLAMMISSASRDDLCWKVLRKSMEDLKKRVADDECGIRALGFRDIGSPIHGGALLHNGSSWAPAHTHTASFEPRSWRLPRTSAETTSFSIIATTKYDPIRPCVFTAVLDQATQSQE